MWTEFDGRGNPWISTTHENRLRMFCKYEVEQTWEIGFRIIDERKPAPKGYAGKKEVVRDLAIQWQARFGEFAYSYDDLARWTDFFEWAGRKYGLLREFRENGIC